MRKTVMLADNGFEEIEAVSVIDILRRGEIECHLCSMTGDRLITGSHGIKIQADRLYSDFSEGELSDIYDAVILPGGMPGSRNLRDNESVIDELKNFDKKGKFVSAICAAPIALERAGLLKNKKVTFFPKSIENENALIYTMCNTEQDGNIITGKAPGAAAEFAFRLIANLKSKELADKIKADMFY